jgi:mRNA interferase MazF
VISVDQLGSGMSQLAISVPLTSRDREQPIHVKIDPPEAGIRSVSYAMPEQVRAISRERLVERWGRVRPDTLEQVIHRVHLLTRAP